MKMRFTVLVEDLRPSPGAAEAESAVVKGLLKSAWQFVMDGVCACSDDPMSAIVENVEIICEEGEA